MTTVVASHFLAGAILTLVLPLIALTAMGIYWWSLLRRRSQKARE